MGIEAGVVEVLPLEVRAMGVCFVVGEGASLAEVSLVGALVPSWVHLSLEVAAAIDLWAYYY